MPIIVRPKYPYRPGMYVKANTEKGPSISGVPFVHKYSSSQTPCYVEPDTWLALQTIASNPYLASPFLPVMQQCPMTMVVCKGKRPQALFGRGEIIIQLFPNQGLQRLSRTRHILDSPSRDMFERRVAPVWC
jgi:hypothetical protein